jgi:outer membrane receptor protein involved in Fe transport
MLAPGTTLGDGGLGDRPLVSFGGASVAENVFYINGMDVTNFYDGLGGNTTPFEFYQEFQVKTGGYGAVFGRSTGGVINAVTKRGGSEWRFGAGGYWEPDSLRETSRCSMQPPELLSAWRVRRIRIM